MGMEGVKLFNKTMFVKYSSQTCFKFLRATLKFLKHEKISSSYDFSCCRAG